MFQALAVPGAGVTAVNVIGNNLCSQLQPLKAGETGLKSQRYETKSCTLPWRETGVVKSQKEMRIECVCILFLGCCVG